MPHFSQGFGPVTTKKVAALKRRLGVRLPADYERFLATVNGGVPEPNCFTVPDRGDALVGILFGLREERTYGDLEWEQEQATLWDPLPPGYIAIGVDPGGCTLLLATLGDEAGRVFFWDRKGFWVRKDGRNTFLVADTFTDFLKALHVGPS